MCTQARIPSGSSPERERVVEVLGRVRVDGVREELAEVDAALERGFGRVVRLEPLPRARLDQQAFEDILDPGRRPEHLLDVCTAAAGPNDGEVAGGDVADPLRLDRQGHAGREVRLTDDEPAAAADLDHQPGGPVAQTRRKRRMVSPEPSAPIPSPMPSRISAVIGNASACGRLRGSGARGCAAPRSPCR